jgi:hypothetical protein
MSLEMVTSRYSGSAIYHLGTFSNILALLETTKDSYDPKSKGLAAFNNNIQAAMIYIREAYLPLSRFSRAYSWVEKLLTGKSATIIDGHGDIFEVNKMLVECNIGYLMLEKLGFLANSASAERALETYAISCRTASRSCPNMVRAFETPSMIT